MDRQAYMDRIIEEAKQFTDKEIDFAGADTVGEVIFRLNQVDLGASEVMEIMARAAIENPSDSEYSDIPDYWQY